MSLPNLLSRLSLLGNRAKSINKEALVPYTYTPINEAAREIRLLTLQRGRRKDPITITLTNTPFTVDHVPAFEALSYTWGSPKNPIDVFVTYSSGTFSTISVTKNLGEALPYLRYKDRDRVLWIDAICVNQRDLEERSQQVQRMAELFSKAIRVVAWLGPSTNQTSVAIKCLNTITSNVKGVWGKEVLEAVSNDGSWADRTVAPPFSRKEYFAMTEFLGSEWFERLWIYQEIRLSSVNSILLCGQHSIQWELFRNVVYFLLRKIDLRNASQILQDRIIIAGDLCRYGVTNPIDSLLDQTKNCKCLDPRDRIYALLSLMSNSGRDFGITPDYTKSLRKVYTDAFKSIVASTSNFDILLNVDMDEFTEWAPTWVPDWSRPKMSYVLPLHYASGKSRAVPQFPSERVMQVEGTIVDSITFAEPFQSQSQNPGRTQATALEVKRVALHLMPTIFELGEFSLRSICRTLCAGEFSDRYVPPRTFLRDVTQTVKHIREILFAQEDAWPSFDSAIFGNIARFSNKRSVCKTSKGRLVLAPNATRQGDIVTVFLGCPNPMILRSAQDDTFKVIGEAYCDEIAGGEALMGSMLGGFKRLLSWKEDEQIHYYVFLNSETGCFQSEDPRLSRITLPLGWRKEGHEHEEWWQWFVNDITGKKTQVDPRLTAEALRERGVDIQTLNLV